MQSDKTVGLFGLAISNALSNEHHLPNKKAFLDLSFDVLISF